MKLQPKQQLAAQLLATGRSGRAVCKELEIDQTTLVRWKKSALFDSYLRELSQAADVEAKETLRRLGGRALEKIASLLDCGNPAVELKTAEVILDRIAELPEISVESELDAEVRKRDEELRREMLELTRG